MEENGVYSRETCNRRMERLKNLQIDPPVNYRQRIMYCELYEAVRDGNVDIFVDVLKDVCLRKRLPLSKIMGQATPSDDSLLHVAAEFGRKNIAELVLGHYPELLIVTNNRGDTPLHVAAKAKNINVMEIILAVYDTFGYARLKSTNGSAVPDDKGYFIELKNKYGNTALHEAVLSKHLDGVTLLLNAHSGIDALGRYWNDSPSKSPMYLAALTGDVKILSLLLQIPFPSNQAFPCCHGNSPLHVAISERNPVLLQNILDTREELMYLMDEKGDTPLHYAAYSGYVEGVRVLLKRSTVTAFEKNSHGNLPIHLACEMGHVQVVKELLQLEWSNARLLNNEGRNILHIAAMNGKNNVVNYLLRNPKIPCETVNESDLNGDTPLHLASRKFCLWTLLSLSRDRRIDVNLVNNQGLTARDIVRMHCKIPMTRQEFLSDVILESVGVSLKANMLGVRCVAFANTEWNVKDAANTLILVSILIATVTFAAGFTVPGGVYSSDDPNPEKRGMAVLAHQTLFKIFMAFNTIAMYSSTLGSIILLWVQLGDRRFGKGVYGFAKLFVYLAIITMSVAFMAAIRLVVSNNSLLPDVISVIGFIFIFFILFLRILGRFPLGIRLPFFRQVAEFLIKILLILFYGRNDMIDEVGQVSPIHQVNQVSQDNQVNQASQVNQVDQICEIGGGVRVNGVTHSLSDPACFSKFFSS